MGFTNSKIEPSMTSPDGSSPLPDEPKTKPALEDYYRQLALPEKQNRIFRDNREISKEDMMKLRDKPDTPPTPDLPSSSSSDATSLQPQPFDNSLRNFDRLSLPFALRLPLSVLIGSTAGFILGAAHGSQESSLRFRAENAHRLPSTQAGWYLYHKSKNYNVILGGLYEGWRMSFRLGAWAALFVGLEEGVDRGRAAVRRSWTSHIHPERFEDEGEVVAVERDFLSTTLAGIGTAGAFSAWSSFPLPTAVRVMKMGAKAGLGFGALQDVVSVLRGRKLGYVEAVRRLAFGSDEREVNDLVKARAG